MREQDILRHKNEVMTLEKQGYFVNQKGEDSRDLANQNPKFLPHVVQPKGPVSSFMMFNKTFSSEIKKLNPDLSMTETTKIIGQKWNGLTEEEKLPYQKMADDDKIRQQ